MFQKLIAQARQILTSLQGSFKKESVVRQKPTCATFNDNTHEQLLTQNSTNAISLNRATGQIIEDSPSSRQSINHKRHSTRTNLLKNEITSTVTCTSESANTRNNLSTKPSDILKPLLKANRCAFWIPGFALASWTPLIPFIKSNFNLGAEHLGLVLMCLATGQAIATLFSPMLIGHLGCRRTVKFMGLAIVISLLSITLLSNIYLIGLVLMLYGWMCETVSMTANLNAVRLESHFKRPLLSGLHGVLSLGSVAGVILVTAMLHVSLTLPLPVLCSAELMSLLILLYCSQVASRNLLSKEQMFSPYLGIVALAVLEKQRPQEQAQRQTIESNLAQEPKLEEYSTNSSSQTRATSLKQRLELMTILKNPVLWGLGLMCLIIYVTEDSVNDWSGVFLVQYYGVPMQEASLGFLAFAIMMALSRLMGDRLVLKFGRRLVIFGGAILTACGFILSTSGISTSVSLLGFALVGLGTANIAPQCISYAASLKSLPASSIFVVNGVGAFGSLAGPAIIGQLSALVTLHHTFLMLAVALTGVAALGITLIKESQKSTLSTDYMVKTESLALHAQGHIELQQNSLQEISSLETARALFSRRFLWQGQSYQEYERQEQLRPQVHQDQDSSHLSIRALSWSPSDFVSLENPNLFWQNLSLQHWTISLDEPPGR